MLPEQGVVRALRQRRQGAALVYTGPAGVGKTHAARALLTRLGVPVHMLPATLPLSDWPARLPAPRALPAWAAAALRRPPDGDGAVAALTALLAALAPVGVLVDDLHDALDPQAEALVRLAGAVGKTRGVALLLTTRRSAPPGVAACPVEPLPEAGTRALAEQELGPGVPTEATAWVHGRAQGNPLFTLEFLRHLARSGHLYSDGQRWHWRVPDGARLPGRVEALIELALNRVGTGDRAVLEARARVPDAPEAVWAAVAGVDPAALRLSVAALQGQGVLGVPEAHFCHPLYAEVLRAHLGGARRRELARRALEAERADALRAVAHLDEAALPPTEAAALLQAAAALAADRGQAGLAGTLLGRASDHSDGAARAELALRGAELLQGTALPRALDLARRALAHPPLAARALPIAATLQARIGGRPALEELLGALPPGPPAGLPIHGARMAALQATGDHAGVLALWDTLDAGARAGADLAARYAVTVSLMAVGRREEAAEHLEGWLSGPLDPGERPRLQGARVILLFQQGRYGEAADLAREAAAALRASGNLLTASALEHNRAAFLRMRGELDAAMDAVRGALETRRDLGDARGYASSLGLLGELELERGHLGAAEDALTEALGTLGLLDGAHFLLNTLSMLTVLHTLGDAPQSGALALHYAARALEVARELQNPRMLVETLADASRAHTRAGDPAGGLRLAREAGERAATLDLDPRTRARNRVALGLAQDALGERAAALTALEEAEAIARAHEGDYEADRIALDLARLRGDRPALERLARTFAAGGQGLGALLARRALGAPPDAAGAPVDLCVLGPLLLGGRAVRGERRRALLLRLLGARLAGRAEVGRLDLADDLYPGQPEGRALGALKQAVAALRAEHGRGTVLTTALGYALGAGTSDAERFLAAPDLALWRGPLPEELGEAPREALLHALRRHAGEALDLDPHGSARAGRLLLEGDPLDEAALRLTLSALRASGHHRSLARLYGAARAEHADVGTALPERWQDYLAASG